ncbi:MAG: GNAT family N-acetyltransferase [Lachnospiraceae bacterium]|nr:GNAT family N-acetyltransferase [Lachnospiraceae bacterium]
MFKKVRDDAYVSEIIDFVKNDYFHCPFLYTNLVKYGIHNPNTSLYVLTEQKSLIAVAFLYYDCLHLYFRNSFKDFDNIIHIINELNPRKIFMPSSNSTLSLPLLDYSSKEVLVMAPKHFSDIDTSYVKNAEQSDIYRIAQFMCTEWADGYDSVADLCQQMSERIADNYGRTKYIESEGNIVACVSSYAELNDFAVCGGLLVSDTQRGKKLGSVMLRAIYEELSKEGKSPCGIIVEDYSRIFHEKNGFAIVGKIVQCTKHT